MELFRQLDFRQTDKQTDRQTDGLTELFLKSLSRLKNNIIWMNVIKYESANTKERKCTLAIAM